MLKRKQTLKSPVELKKTRTSIGETETPRGSSVAAQRQRAKEWAENDAKRLTQADEEKSTKAKRAATPSGKTPGKRSKIVYDEDPEPEVRPPPRSTRKSVASTASAVSEEPSAVASASTRTARKTPVKAKIVKAEESDEESVPVPDTKPTRKTPAKARTSTAAASSKTPVTTSKKTTTKTQPSTTATTTPPESSLPLIPIPITGPSPFVTPTVTPAKTDRPLTSTQTGAQASAQASSRNNTRAALACSLTPEESYLIEETTRPRPSADSLSPPSNFLTNMVTMYIFIGGIAYYDPQLGFLLFLAVSILANLFVMSGLNEE